MTMMKHGALLLALALVALASSLAWAEAPAAASRGAVPSWELEDLRGDTVRSSDLKGQVVVISFWATWCVPCKQELSMLQKLYEEHRGAGFTVIAVATDGPETFAKIRGTVKKHNWKFPVLPDREGRVAAALNPRGTTPYTMFIDRRGLLAYDHEGFSQGDEKVVVEHIEALLAEK